MIGATSVEPAPESGDADAAAAVAKPDRPAATIAAQPSLANFLETKANFLSSWEMVEV
jgi:hypothetical protein